MSEMPDMRALQRAQMMAIGQMGFLGQAGLIGPVPLIGAVPLSPQAPRIAELEADNARLLAENTALASLVRELGEKNARLLECNTQLWAKAFQQPKAEPAPGFPARALAGRKQRIGLTTEIV